MMGRPKKEFTDLEAREICAMYKRKIPLKEIAERFTCSTTPILGLLKESGLDVDIPERQSGEEGELQVRHKKRFYDEKEKFPQEKFDVPGAGWVENKLKALGYAQSMINKVFSFYLNNGERYNENPQLLTDLLKACRIREEVAKFLANELNTYMFPRPGEKLAFP